MSCQRVVKTILIVLAIALVLIFAAAFAAEYRFAQPELIPDDDLSPPIIVAHSDPQHERVAGGVPFEYSYMLEAQAIDDESRLFLGPAQAATNIEWMNDVGMTHILNVGADDNSWIQGKTKVRNYKYIDRNDREDVPLFEEFAGAFRYIDRALESDPSNKIMVHCHAGVSRSATIVLAYLMYKYQLTMYDAVKHVMSRRPVILPNAGFTRQLRDFEQAIKKNKLKTPKQVMGWLEASF